MKKTKISKLKPWLKGVIIPMLTPFRSNEDLDEEALRRLTDFLIEQGVHGLFPNSSIGEQPKLSMDERKRVISVVVDQANGRVPVMPGTGDISTRATIELTRYAKDAGADAAVIVEPYYFRPSPNAIYEHYELIANSVDIPIVLYDVPCFTGYTLPADLIIKSVDIDNVVAMKDSSNDMVRFVTLLNKIGDKIALLQGIDSLFLPSLIAGSPGGMLGGGNVMAELEVELYNSFLKGDLKKAEELHKKIVKVCDACGQYAIPAGFKKALEIMGIQVGNARKPIEPLTMEQIMALKQVLVEAGL